ncbi:hypothetical protein [Gordonia sp. (in: high G+C Gram-positive bacteria)]|uniref:hypothetical protein n=1 Tax=unclassified Gordonia (in: high G+C Gram-positive bacteria) TaxID=2657482 RepID=UPI003528E0EB
MLPRLRYFLDDLTTADAAGLRARDLTTTVKLTFSALRRGPDFTRWLLDWARTQPIRWEMGPRAK